MQRFRSYAVFETSTGTAGTLLFTWSIALCTDPAHYSKLRTYLSPAAHLQVKLAFERASTSFAAESRRFLAQRLSNDFSGGVAPVSWSGMKQTGAGVPREQVKKLSEVLAIRGETASADFRGWLYGRVQELKAQNPSNDPP